MYLLIFFEVFVLYNITQILSESGLFQWARRIPILGTKLLSCFLCTSVWVGIALSFILPNVAYKISGSIVIYNYDITWFFNAMFLSSLGLALHIIEDKLTK